MVRRYSHHDHYAFLDRNFIKHVRFDSNARKNTRKRCVHSQCLFLHTIQICHLLKVLSCQFPNICANNRMNFLPEFFVDLRILSQTVYEHSCHVWCCVCPCEEECAKLIDQVISCVKIFLLSTILRPVLAKFIRWNQKLDHALEISTFFVFPTLNSFDFVFDQPSSIGSKIIFFTINLPINLPQLKPLHWLPENNCYLWKRSFWNRQKQRVNIWKHLLSIYLS